MCGPQAIVPVLALAVSAAGTAAQISGQNQANKARRQEVEAATEQQTQIRNRALAGVAEATQQTGRQSADAATQTAADQRTVQYNTATELPASGAALPPTIAGNSIVSSSLDANRARNAAYLGTTNQALGNLNGWQDAFGAMGRTVARSGEGVATQGTNARASAGLIDGQLLGASRAGQNTRALGDVGVGLGTLATGSGNSLSGLFSTGGGAKAGMYGTSGGTK